MKQKFVEGLIIGVAIAQAVFVGLASLFAAWRFWAKADSYHIVAVAVSHFILTALVATGMVRYWQDQWWSQNFRTPLALFAFALTSYGLLKLANGRKRNGKN